MCVEIIPMCEVMFEGGPNGISPNDPFKSNTGGSRVPPWGVKIHSVHQFIISSSSVCHQFVIREKEKRRNREKERKREKREKKRKKEKKRKREKDRL